MPRELVHWEVVYRSVRLLEEQNESFFLPSLKAFGGAALSGAIAHDAGYYHRYGNSPLGEIAEYLHGTDGEDTFQPMRDFLSSVGGSSPSATRAFLFGMITHIAADVVFHPAVYYFTGDYYDPDHDKGVLARTRHRLFEVYMDEVLTQLHPPREAVIKRAYASFPKEKLYEALSRVYPKLDLQTSTSFWKESFQTIATMQQLFRSPIVGLAVRGLSTMFPRKYGEYDALFRFGRTTPPQWMASEWSFKNPVTGEPRTATFEALLEEATDLAVRMCRDFKNEGAVGPSLNFGIPHAKRDACRFFDTQWWEVTSLAPDWARADFRASSQPRRSRYPRGCRRD